MSETLAQAAERQFGFNPFQKRDAHGRWSVGDVVKDATGRVGTVRKVHDNGDVTVRVGGDGEEGESKVVKGSSLSKVPRPAKLTPAQKRARERRLNDLDKA